MSRSSLTRFEHKNNNNNMIIKYSGNIITKKKGRKGERIEFCKYGEYARELSG